MSISIVPASPDDVPEIRAIYNEVIRTSTAVYSNTEVSLAERQAWFDKKVRDGFPVFAARDASGLVGFGTFGEFRAWPCYEFSVEHSVHIRRDSRGQGIGRSLVMELLLAAQRMGKHVMLAGIDADNAASIHLHERLGFSRAGHLREVGYKFDRWLDLVFMQRRIASRDAPAEGSLPA